jgi:hypothetical protein
MALACSQLDRLAYTLARLPVSVAVSNAASSLVLSISISLSLSLFLSLSLTLSLSQADSEALVAPAGQQGTARQRSYSLTTTVREWMLCVCAARAGQGSSSRCIVITHSGNRTTFDNRSEQLDCFLSNRRVSSWCAENLSWRFITFSLSVTLADR